MNAILESLTFTICMFLGPFILLFRLAVGISIWFLFTLGIAGLLVGFAAKGWEGAWKMSYIQFTFAFIGMFLNNLMKHLLRHGFGGKNG